MKSKAQEQGTTVVFIGGSRRSKLNADVKARIDRIMDQSFPVVVGDANGADKAVQGYLAESRYPHVEVFCTGNAARNNIGAWPLRQIAPPRTGGRKDRAYYTAKDKVMAREASFGLVIWDGKSMGTMAQALRMVLQEKAVVVYRTQEKSFLNLRTREDWLSFAESSLSRELRDQVESSVAPDFPGCGLGSQLGLAPGPAHRAAG